MEIFLVVLSPTWHEYRLVNLGCTNGYVTYHSAKRARLFAHPDAIMVHVKGESAFDAMIAHLNESVPQV